MKKLIPFLFLFLVSCQFRKTPEWYGTWGGDYFFVKVYYFLNGSSYEQRTYSSNMVWVGGTKGELEVEKDLMIFRVKQEYVSDVTGKGHYESADKILPMRFILDKDLIVFNPNTDLEIILQKQ